MLFRNQLAILISFLCLITLSFSCSSSSDGTYPTPTPSSETIYRVTPATSPYNVFSDITIPQNPGLADNNWNGGHQDSYCSESVGLSGPNTEYVKLVQRENPYGFTPVMACNSNNQMIGAAYSYDDGVYRLIVFDENLTS